MGIGIKIKNILEQKGMTIKELSEKTGISINTLYGITKRDSKNVSQDTIKKIAQALEVNSLELLDIEKIIALAEKAKDSGDIDSAEMLLNIGEHVYRKQYNSKSRLLIAFDFLNETGQEKAIQYVEDLSKISEYVSNEYIDLLKANNPSDT